MRIPVGRNCSLEADFSWPPQFGFQSWASRQVRSWYLGLGFLQIHYYGGWYPVQMGKPRNYGAARRYSDSYSD